MGGIGIDTDDLGQICVMGIAPAYYAFNENALPTTRIQYGVIHTRGFVSE